MELNIAVVDDILGDRVRITENLGQFFAAQNGKYNVSTFDSAESFLKVYRKGVFNIVFLDICIFTASHHFGERRRR